MRLGAPKHLKKKMKVYLIYGVYNDEETENFGIVSDSLVADDIVRTLSSLSKESLWRYYVDEFVLDNLDDFLSHLP